MVQISLKIKLIEGNDQTIEIDDEYSIADLREKIRQITQIPCDQQRLIFRGRVLTNGALLIKDNGLADGLAVHVVTKKPPVEEQARQPQTGTRRARQWDNEAVDANLSQMISQNLIIGHIPFERTTLFREPNEAMTAVSTVINQIRATFDIDSENTLHLNRPSIGDFTINVIFRGLRDHIVNSPARERFETLKVEIKKLVWLISLVEAQFIPNLDAVFSGEPEPNQESAYRSISDILTAMHTFDHFDEELLRRFVQRHRDTELLALLQELDSWELQDDEAHVQQLNRFVRVRHCLSVDFDRLLLLLSMVDAKINEHLQSRYRKVLHLSHNQTESSYTARLLNCYTSTMARLQHLRAHIYHVISDIGIHVDANQHNRLYPQFVSYERQPPQADISLMFYNPRGNGLHSFDAMDTSHSVPASPRHSVQGQMPQADELGSSGRTESSTNPQGTSLNSMLSGFMNFAQHLIGASPHPSSANSANLPPNSRPMNPTSLRGGGLPPARLTLDQSRPQRSISAERTTQHGQERPQIRARRTQHSIGVASANIGGWSQTSPEAPNVMFVGPNPPSVFPLFTMDPFLPCSSRRYRVFESDSRHADFWNDPTTIALGLTPPSDSIAAAEHGNDHNHAERTRNTSEHFANRANISQTPQGNGRTLGEILNENSTIRPHANDNGEAVFDNIEHFSEFVRQTLESVARCMAQYDSSIVPTNSAQQQRGFTANSRVSGFVPLMSHSPFPFGIPHHIGGPLGGNAPAIELTITADAPNFHGEGLQRNQGADGDSAN